MTQEDLKQIGDLVKDLLTQELVPIKEDISGLQQSISVLEQGQVKLECQVGYLHAKLLEHDNKFQEMDENMRKWKNEILISNDKVVAELQMIRSEQIAHLGSRDRMDDILENHEIRIIKLEQSATV